MKTFLIYTSSGSIRQLSTALDRESVETGLPNGLAVLEIPEAVSPEAHYVSAGKVVPKPDLDTICTLSTGNWKADGVSELTYGPALPNPTKVTITSSSPAFIPPAPFSVTDGTLELTTAASGEYTITLEAFPYLQKVIRVSAT